MVKAPTPPSGHGRAGTTSVARAWAPPDARPAGPAPAPLVRPAAPSRAAHARPDSRPVTESPCGPPHRSPATRVLSGRLRPAHHPFPGHTTPDVALEYRQITPIRRTGSLDTSRQRNGPVSGHVSGTYPLIPAYQDLGFATATCTAIADRPVRVGWARPAAHRRAVSGHRGLPARVHHPESDDCAWQANVVPHRSVKELWIGIGAG